MALLPDIDWHRFRAGTVVGSKMDNRIYEITGFEYVEQVDIGQPRNVRQNIELELGPSMSSGPPDWWLPANTLLGGSYVLLDDNHAYMMMSYDYELPMQILKVELSRATWADQEAMLTPFQQAVQSFRQSLTSSR